VTPYRFTGQREESTIGLYFYNARWYDPLLGRFTQADTIVPEPGNPQALNRYSYVLNSPVRYTDPSGHMHPEDNRPYFPPKNEPFDPPVPGDYAYNYAESWVTGVQGIGGNFFLGTGQETQYYYPDNSLTHDVMCDPLLESVRLQWAKKGYPLPFVVENVTIDVRDRKVPFLVRLVLGADVYVIEHLELLLTTFHLGSRTPEGPIDVVGATVGSFDRVTIYEAPEGWVRFEVYSKTTTTSFLRIPGTDIGPPEYSRSWLGPGGTTHQYFMWWERQPDPRSGR
jgi:RHS repeat-associated protein